MKFKNDPRQLVATLIWNLSERSGIGLGKYAPTIFGWMIGDTKKKIKEDDK